MSIGQRILAGALAAAAGMSNAADIDVMTQNQYIGADLTPVLSAALAVPFDPASFSAAVVGTLQKIAATRPAERTRALAAEILRRNPDVVGLQEAYELRCLPYPGVPEVAGRGCDDANIRAAFTDHLADTLAALGGAYRAGGRVTNLAVAAIPFVVDGQPALLAIADRDAILVRHGWNSQAVDLVELGACAKPSDQGCNYTTAPPPIPTPIGTLAIERGFLAVDVNVRGRGYRVFNTHLEQRLLAPSLPETRLLQVGQAYELAFAVLGPARDASRTTVVLGDLNSDPADAIPVPPYPPTLPDTVLPTLPPYAVLTGSGLTDTWTLRAPSGDGTTCCQSEDLLNVESGLYERIDYVFTVPKPALVLGMKRLGNTIGEKTVSPGQPRLWPSDHAALAARLQFD